MKTFVVTLTALLILTLFVVDDSGTAQVAAPVTLASAVSRITHGGAGPFDVPLTGTPATECRSGLVPNSSPKHYTYTIVFTFTNNLVCTSFCAPSGQEDGDPLVSCGAVDLVNSRIDPSDSHNYILVFGFDEDLPTIPGCNVHNITATLRDVNDAAGNHSDTVSVTMSLLIGDTNRDRSVNVADIGQTKSQSGNVVNAANFREDVTASGAINVADIGLVKSKAGTALPP